MDVAIKLNELADLSRSDLIEIWIDTHKKPPPKGLSRRLLVYNAAYRIQSKVSGGLKPALCRKLDQRIGGRAVKSTNRNARSNSTTPPPGARLMRDWQGRTYTVEVLDDGFLYEGAHYRSLSKVARVITGTHWSGPRFFGL